MNVTYEVQTKCNLCLVCLSRLVCFSVLF